MTALQMIAYLGPWSWWSFLVGVLGMLLVGVVAASIHSSNRPTEGHDEDEDQPAYAGFHLSSPVDPEDAATKDLLDAAFAAHRGPLFISEPVQITPLPAFGPPATRIYNSDDYVSPMRCSGSKCGHRLFTTGEPITVIPVVNGPEGAEIALGAECAMQSAP